MNQPTQRSRRGFAVAATVLALLVAGVVAGEVAGWPFLAAPAERALSKTLQRDVQLGNPSDGESGATVRFFGGLKIKVPELQIAAPMWSKRPFFLHASQAEMHLSYGDLWRARGGAPLDIALLHADTLVVHAERLADGRASWALGSTAPEVDADEAGPTRMPTVRELRVLQGQLSFVDAPLKADITARLQLSEGASPTSAATPASPPASGSRPLPAALRGLIASAEGTYGPVRLTAKLRSTGIAPCCKKRAMPLPCP